MDMQKKRQAWLTAARQRVAAATLYGRELTIVELRLGMRGQRPMTQGEIGAIVGLSAARIGRIEREIYERLGLNEVWRNITSKED